MKKTYFLLAFLMLSLTSCSGDDNDNTVKTKTTVVFGKEKKVTNLYAPATGKGFNPADKEGEFVKFSFKTGAVTNSKTDWDIAFRYATILVNGGAKVGYKSEPERTGDVSVYVAKNVFEDVKSINEDNFKQDNTGTLAIDDDVLGKNGIWSYNMEKHYVLPIPGRILVFQTSNKKKCKNGSFKFL